MGIERHVCLVVVVVSAVAACGRVDSPLHPGTVIPPGQLALRGPTTVPPGGALHYQAVLMGSAGSAADVTEQASWESESPTVLTVSAPGVYAAAQAPGEGDIRAMYQGQFAIAHVYVMDPGTFIVRGHVFDGSLPVSGARVDVIAGTGSGLHTLTSVYGAYSLVGVGGAVTLGVTYDGYEPETRTLTVSNNNDTALDFTLTPLGGRSDVSGAWVLTFTASPSCTGFPTDATRRTYPVTIAQNGPTLAIKLTMPNSTWSTDFLELDGLLRGTALTFTLPEDAVDGPWLSETLGEGLTFTLAGNGSAQLNNGVFLGHLDGDLSVYTTWPGMSCAATDHALTLARPGS